MAPPGLGNSQRWNGARLLRRRRHRVGATRKYKSIHNNKRLYSTFFRLRVLTRARRGVRFVSSEVRMRPEELENFESALRAKWEAERNLEDIRKKLLTVSVPDVPSELLHPVTLKVDEQPVDAPAHRRIPIPDADPNASKYTRMFIDFLSRHPEGQAPSAQIADAIDPEHPARVVAALVRAVRRGEVMRSARGVYCLPRRNE